MNRSRTVGYAGALWTGLRGAALLVGGLCVASSTGCAEVSHHQRDRLVRTRTEHVPVGGWEYTGGGMLVRDDRGAVTAVRASLLKDRACRMTQIRTVDRTVVNERTLQNQRMSRIMAYTVGSLGAAGMVTNVVAAVQTDDPDARDVFTVFGDIGALLSISLITMIVREFSAIDTETHVGLVDVPESRRARCDTQPPAGARVRLLRTKDTAVAEGVVSAEGTVVLPVDGASLQGDAIYALEVAGVIVGHLEIPAASAAAAPPASAAAIPPASAAASPAASGAATVPASPAAAPPAATAPAVSPPGGAPPAARPPAVKSPAPAVATPPR